MARVCGVIARAIADASLISTNVADAPKPDKDHGGIAAGDTCEVKQAGGSEWRKFRVSGPQRLGESILRLTLEAEFA